MSIETNKNNKNKLTKLSKSAKLAEKLSPNTEKKEKKSVSPQKDDDISVEETEIFETVDFFGRPRFFGSVLDLINGLCSGGSSGVSIVSVGVFDGVG